MDKISVKFVSDLFNSGLDKGSSGHGAKVALETEEGRKFTAEQPRVPGWPEYPITEERLVETFHQWAEMFLTEAETNRVKELIDELEKKESLDEILSILKNV